MKSQKIYEISDETEKIKNLPHTFSNFRDENEYHSAFFDPNHSNEILEYEDQQPNINEF